MRNFLTSLFVYWSVDVHQCPSDSFIAGGLASAWFLWFGVGGLALGPRPRRGRAGVAMGDAPAPQRPHRRRRPAWDHSSHLSCFEFFVFFTHLDPCDIACAGNDDYNRGAVSARNLTDMQQDNTSNREITRQRTLVSAQWVTAARVYRLQIQCMRVATRKTAWEYIPRGERHVGGDTRREAYKRRGHAGA